MGGVGEISSLSFLQVKINSFSVPIHPLTKRAAERLGFDPLRLIASGSLLAAVPPEKRGEAMQRLARLGIDAAVVGVMGDRLEKPVPEPSEELWRLLKMEGVQDA